MLYVQITDDQRKRLRSGDTELLVALLQDSSKKVIEVMKKRKEMHGIAFHQGASCAIDTLLEILSA